MKICPCCKKETENLFFAYARDREICYDCLREITLMLCNKFKGKANEEILNKIIIDFNEKVKIKNPEQKKDCFFLFF